MSLDLNELRELLTALNQTDIAELTLKSEAFELTVRRNLRSEPRLAEATVSPSITVPTPEIVAPASALAI
ncbi:MAG TPA: hypothetical protein V6D18_05670, partial [Thermosynechococcaceae cyanobacterium]